MRRGVVRGDAVAANGFGPAEGFFDPLFDHLGEVIEIVAGIRDYSTEPYLEKLRAVVTDWVAVSDAEADADADYERVMASAVSAFREWRNVPAPRRGEAVRRIGEALRAKKDLLGSLVTLEMGKIKAEGDGEVQEMIDIADFAVGQSRMLYGLSMHSERPNHRMFEQWHPLGVVGVISAFNFPVAVWAWNAFLAAVCGNVTVWKPSLKTALCAVAVQHICNRVLERHGYPGIFQLFVDASHDLATRFVDDRRVALVSFTGSTHVGRDVGERVARRLGKSLLELGGNNAIIVDEFANLDLAVPAIVFGAVGTAGQRCTTTRRVLVHEPGPEIDRMVPPMMEELLFDDILFGERAREEHRRFQQVLRLQYPVDGWLQGGRNMKYCLNNCPLRTRADLGQVRAPTNHCFHCIQDNGFACAGLPGHRGQTRLEDQLQAIPHLGGKPHPHRVGHGSRPHPPGPGGTRPAEGVPR